MTMKCPKCENPPTVKHCHGEGLDENWASWDFYPPKGWKVDMKLTYLTETGILIIRLKRIRKKVEGKCQTCGKELPEPQMNLCSDCFDKNGHTLGVRITAPEEPDGWGGHLGPMRWVERKKK